MVFLWLCDAIFFSIVLNLGPNYHWLAICNIIRREYKNRVWLISIFWCTPTCITNFFIPETKRYAFFCTVPASLVARQVNQPLSRSETLFITNVPFAKTLKYKSLPIESCDLNHLIKGSGSPEAEHGILAVCPLGMVWFIGDSVKIGGTGRKERKEKIHNTIKIYKQI